MGWRSSTACIASASNAVAALLGRRPATIEEYAVDAVYESAPAATPVAPWQAGRNSFLGSGPGFALRPRPENGATLTLAPAQAAALGLGEIAALVQWGLIHRRRCRHYHPGTLHVGRRHRRQRLAVEATAEAGPDSPVYLAGRFGRRPAIALVGASDQRRFDVGAWFIRVGR